MASSLFSLIQCGVPGEERHLPAAFPFVFARVSACVTRQGKVYSIGAFFHESVGKGAERRGRICTVPLTYCKLYSYRVFSPQYDARLTTAPPGRNGGPGECNTLPSRSIVAGRRRCRESRADRGKWMLENLLIAAFIMAGLGVLLSVLVAIASKRLFVFEDPRIDDVEQMLPGANCGACGQAGCRAFAEAVVFV